MTAQAGTVYRYFRADCDHDISGDNFELSLNTETGWFSIGVEYIAPIDLPASCVARDAADPPDDGFAGYWWRVMTGPGTPLPLQRGKNTVYGRLTDNTEIPHFSWDVFVGVDE